MFGIGRQMVSVDKRSVVTGVVIVPQISPVGQVGLIDVVGAKRVAVTKRFNHLGVDGRLENLHGVTVVVENTPNDKTELALKDCTLERVSSDIEL